MPEIRLLIYALDLNNLQTTHKKAKKYQLAGVALFINDNNKNPQT